MEKSTGQFLHLWAKQGILTLITGEQTKVLMTILEKITCYPEHQKLSTDRISISQFTEATKLCRSTVVAALKIFRDAKLIATGNTNHKGREYKLLGGEFELAKLQKQASGNVKRKRPAVHNIDCQKSIPQTGLPDRLPEKMKNLRVAKNTRAVYPVYTPNINDKRKERLNVYKQKPNVISFSIFEKLRESKDKIKTCIEIYNLAEKGSEISNVATTLWTVFEFLKETGAGDDIDRSWEAHLKYVRRYSDSKIQKIMAEIRDDIRQGKPFRNIPAIYTNKLKEISLEPKRGMAKAEPAKQQIRKVA